MANLLDTFKEYITPELIISASQTLGESENNISKAIGALAPAILAGLLAKSSDTSAMSSIFSSISRFDPNVVNQLDGLVGGGNLAHNDPKDISGKLMGDIFGSKVPAVTDSVAAFSGVKPSSASSLLGLAGPLLMGILSKKINDSGLNLSGFVNLLVTEKNSILQLLPAGLFALLGFSPAAAEINAGATTEAAVGNKWLWPLLLLLALGAAIVFFMKNCSAAAPMGKPAIVVIDSTAIKAEAARLEAEAEAARAAASTIYNRKLSSGFEVKGNREGIEDRLIAFIEDENRPVDKTTWFNFDHLNFKTGSADLDMEYSQQQLNNIYEVLKAFPAVKIKVGGYTDSDGDDKANMKLSQKRADNVKAALVSMGIAKERLSAEGYGEQHPECPANDTPECKAQNRRIAVRVTEK